MDVSGPGDRLNINMLSYQYRDRHVKDYKNPLHLDVADRYLRRMGDEKKDSRRGSAESGIVLSPMSRRYRSTTINVLRILCLVHQ